jgi:DNA-binding phage protein
MARSPRTGAERYFDQLAHDPAYRAAYDDARRRVDQVDTLVRVLDGRRQELGLSKAELARRAELAPESVRRLFSVDAPNPTAVTLTALADALGLDLVPMPRKG